MSNSSRNGILSAVLAALAAIFKALSSQKSTTAPRRGTQGGAQKRPTARLRTPERLDEWSLGSTGPTATYELDPQEVRGLRIEFAPLRNGEPDGGEVVWTWVPFAERDGRGKDRPVLVIGRQSAERVYAVKLTSKAHDGDRDFLSIGTGLWDQHGRESWVDVDQLYSVHVSGIRREAATLPKERFDRVAELLHRRFGWSR